MVINTRIQDDFSSIGHTSFHRNGPQVVSAACEPLARSSEPISARPLSHFERRQVQISVDPPRPTDYECAAVRLLPLRAQIDSQLLALLIEMAALEAESLGGVCDVALMPLQFLEQGCALKRSNAIRERSALVPC